MMELLKKTARWIDLLNQRVGVAVSWLAGALVLMFCYDVVSRYVFNTSSVAMFEAEWHVFSLLFLLGAGYTLHHDKHVRVDVLYSRFAPRTKAWVNLLGTLFFLLPFCLIVIKGAVPYVELSWRIGEGSSDPGGLPARYLVKSSMIAGFVLLLLQGLSLVVHSLATIVGEPDGAKQKHQE